MRVSVVNLGCKVNRVESDTIAKAYETRGAQLCSVADADIVLREACAAVSYAKPGSGTVTFVCLENKPETNIPVQVEVKR